MVWSDRAVPSSRTGGMYVTTGAMVGPCEEDSSDSFEEDSSDSLESVRSLSRWGSDPEVCGFSGVADCCAQAEAGVNRYERTTTPTKFHSRCFIMPATMRTP